MHVLDTSAEQRRAAVRSLAQGRALESPPGEDGLKAVWHPRVEGADLLSWVDAQGRLYRQEFSLLGDFFLWEAGGEVRTGAVTGGLDGHAQAVASTVTMDLAPQPARLQRAALALRGYGGEDRYLLHLQTQLSRAAAARAPRERPPREVPTREVPTREEALPAAPPVVPAPRRRRIPVGLLLVLFAAAMAALVAWGL